MELPEMYHFKFFRVFLYFVSYIMKKEEFELVKKPEAGYAFAFTEVYFGLMLLTS